MIAFSPINNTVKTIRVSLKCPQYQLFLFFSRCLESVSDFFFLLLIDGTGSLSMGAFLLRVTISRP